jgi:hypothetical protein
MFEIFKSKTHIKRDLLEKIICYETFRRMFYDVQQAFTTIRSDSEIFDKLISSNLNVSKDKLKYLEANKSFGQIKISLQETDGPTNEAMEYIGYPSNAEQEKIL